MFNLGTALQAPESFLTIAENQRVRHPDPIGTRFDSSGWISRVIMEAEPHLDLATFTSSYGFLRSGLLSRGVSVFVYYMAYENTVHVHIYK